MANTDNSKTVFEHAFDIRTSLVHMSRLWAHDQGDELAAVVRQQSGIIIRALSKIESVACGTNRAPKNRSNDGEVHGESGSRTTSE